MRMKKRDREDYHRRIHLPYCLKRMAIGLYIILNREYKPLGMDTTERVNYEDYSHVSLRITPHIAAQLSARESDDIDDVYLYNDGCIPTRSAANMRCYEERLALLEEVRAGSAVTTQHLITS